ncbi:MAG: nitroreductase [Candidatus Lokiarchaeota archaeon]|nr:nitroreductase [Candidatus Lokiarchaeota archaeon]
MAEGNLILDEIVRRRSGRAFSSRPIERDKVHSILEAGRWAPSCSNTQAWQYIVIQEHEDLAKAHDALSRGNAWGKNAPLMVVVAAAEDGGCPAHNLPYFMMDVGLTVQNMLIQAVHVGLMGHPTAGWDEHKLKEILAIPESYRIVTVVFFGYEGNIEDLDERTREKEKKRSSRRPLEEIVHWEKW